MPIAKQLPSGTWRVRIYVGKKDGKDLYESFSAPSKKEAEYLAAQYQMQTKNQKEEAKMSLVDRMTVCEAITQHIDNIQGVLSPTTIRRYRQDSAKFFASIMDIKLCDLTQPDVQRAVSIDAKRYSAKSIHNAHGLLSSALSVYLPDFHLKTNLPQIEEPDLIIPEDGDIKRLVNRIAGTRMEVVVLLGACAGLRRSEICGLMPEDIDVKKSTIKIRRVIVKDENGKWVTKAKTKTTKSKREIEIAPFIIEKMLALPKINEYIIGYVPDTISKSFIDLRDELGLKCRFHDLRHYNASIMLALGIPDKYAMERMGHSTTDMLKKVYQHIMSGKRKEVSDTVNSHMNDLFDDLKGTTKINNQPSMDTPTD